MTKSKKKSKTSLSKRNSIIALGVLAALAIVGGSVMYMNNAGTSTTALAAAAGSAVSGTPTVAKVAPTSTNDMDNLQTPGAQYISVSPSPNSSTWSLVKVGAGTQEMGTYTMIFMVTASAGQDIYISSTTSSVVPLTLFSRAGIATTTNSIAVTSTASRSPHGNFLIHAGQSVQVTITYAKLGQNGSVFARLEGFKYGLTDAAPSQRSVRMPVTYRSPLQYIPD